MEIIFNCPNCDQEYEVESAMAGQHLDCPDCGTHMDVPALRLGPGIVIGGFRLEKHLGRGSMGDVYLGTQLSMGRKVAIKILPPAMTMNQEAVDRFLHEVQTTATLDHPNIVTAFDAGEDNDTFYFAMSFVDGENLDEIVKNQGPFPERKALTLIQPVCRALDYAWKEFRLLHRDIKPENIMIDRHGTVRVMDMGISKSIEEDAGITMPDRVIGTPHYMSPEQAWSEEAIDFRADLYSVGASLYKMVTGSPPYRGSSQAVFAKLCKPEPFPPPNTVNEDLSAACNALIMTMMAADREDRYQSWEELLEDIDRVLAGQMPARMPPNSIPVATAEPDADEALTQQVLMTGTPPPPPATGTQTGMPPSTGMRLKPLGGGAAPYATDTGTHPTTGAHPATSTALREGGQQVITPRQTGTSLSLKGGAPPAPASPAPTNPAPAGGGLDRPGQVTIDPNKGSKTKLSLKSDKPKPPPAPEGESTGDSATPPAAAKPDRPPTPEERVAKQQQGKGTLNKKLLVPVIAVAALLAIAGIVFVGKNMLGRKQEPRRAAVVTDDAKPNQTTPKPPRTVTSLDDLTGGVTPTTPETKPETKPDTKPETAPKPTPGTTPAEPPDPPDPPRTGGYKMTVEEERKLTFVLIEQEVAKQLAANKPDPQAIAEQAGLQWPVAPVKATLERVQQVLDARVDAMVKQKYPPPNFFREAEARYGPYRVGQKVTFLLRGARGEQIDGVLHEIGTDFIRIGDRRINVIDLDTMDRFRLNKWAAQEKMKEYENQLREKYMKDVSAYRDELREKLVGAAHEAAGYVLRDGKWVDPKAVLDAEMEQALARQVAELRQRIEREMFTKRGFRQVDGVWQK